MGMIRRLFCALLALSFLLPSVFPASAAASFEGFPDAQGHWAQAALRQAYSDGLLNGMNGYLRPNEAISTVQALTIISRIFDARVTADLSRMRLSAEEWYYDYIAKAAHLGLVTPAGEAELSLTMTRQDAFHMLAEAFQLIEAEPDYAALGQFSDSALILGENRQALASLVSLGLLRGYDGKLDANNVMTRASFVSLIYRIVEGFVPAAAVRGSYRAGALIQGSARLTGNRFDSGVWLDCAASDIVLDNVTADRAVIRSHTLSSLVVSGNTRIKRLTIAAQAEDIAVSPADSAIVDTLVVGTGGGEISAKGIDVIEITGDNRQVTITDSVRSVIVSGQYSTVNVQRGAHIENVELLMNARGSRVVADGIIDSLEVMNVGALISGGGNVGTLILRRPDTKIDVRHDNVIERIDMGLAGASMSMRLPGSLPAGNALNVTASIENAAPGTVCRLTWYIDDKEIFGADITTGGMIPALTHRFEYSRNMPSTARVRVVAGYVTAIGERQEISAEGTVALDNYGKQHWMQLETPRVLEEVTLGYKGDFTLEWALANDLDDFDKEVWINAMGYASSTEYLLWINLAYQRVNIFRQHEGSWQLIRTCLAGTGAPRAGTPPGVWTTSYKQVNGWRTSRYIVRPVVRFRGTSGYAFHSRLYHPRNGNLIDGSIGFPVSRGCIRMYDEDIWFIHDNIPDGTTVVVH